MACMLTEGTVKAILKDNKNLAIIGVYVKSPLTWGVHVKNDSSYTKGNDLKGKTFGISRFTSGSHLMSFVFAQNKGWKSSDVNFHIVGSLDGARREFKNNKIDAFMWEKVIPINIDIYHPYTYTLIHIRIYIYIYIYIYT